MIKYKNSGQQELRDEGPSRSLFIWTRVEQELGGWNSRDVCDTQWHSNIDWYLVYAKHEGTLLHDFPLNFLSFSNIFLNSHWFTEIS